MPIRTFPCLRIDTTRLGHPSLIPWLTCHLAMRATPVRWCWHTLMSEISCLFAYRVQVMPSANAGKEFTCQCSNACWQWRGGMPRTTPSPSAGWAAYGFQHTEGPQTHRRMICIVKCTHSKQTNGFRRGMNKMVEEWKKNTMFTSGIRIELTNKNRDNLAQQGLEDPYRQTRITFAPLYRCAFVRRNLEHMLACYFASLTFTCHLRHVRLGCLSTSK